MSVVDLLMQSRNVPFAMPRSRKVSSSVVRNALVVVDCVAQVCFEACLRSVIGEKWRGRHALPRAK